MEDLIIKLEPLVEDYGLYVVTLGIMIENTGIPFPGETIMIIGSILAAQGILTLKGVYFAALVGAILGDNFGYAVGRFGGRPFIIRILRLFRLPRSFLRRAEGLFERWGHWAVFFGRFPALLRILAGPLAGMLHMPFWKFFLLNASGASLWAAIIVYIAYKLGENLPLLEKTLKYMGRGAFLLLAFLVVFLVVYHLWLKRKEALANTGEAALSPSPGPSPGGEGNP